MDIGIFAIIMMGIWLILRLKHYDETNSRGERSTIDVLKSIESKLDQLISLQKNSFDK